jgi:NAD(P)-dependent dehydrogenase (short-subunit alcohol dehydrogenase family)
MRVLVVGATGTIGSAIIAALTPRHEVIAASLSRASLHVDLADKASVAALLKTAGQVDAIVSAAGVARFAPMAQLSDDDFALSLQNKLMGQVNLVRLGQAHVTDKGSMTLTSGFLGRHPSVGSPAVSLVNAGLEGFVRAAALELPRDLRINVVSPPWVTETLKARGMDTAPGVPASVVAQAYVRSLEGSETGKVLDP